MLLLFVEFCKSEFGLLLSLYWDNKMKILNPFVYEADAVGKSDIGVASLMNNTEIRASF